MGMFGNKSNDENTSRRLWSANTRHLRFQGYWPLSPHTQMGLGHVPVITEFISGGLGTQTMAGWLWSLCSSPPRSVTTGLEPVTRGQREAVEVRSARMSGLDGGERCLPSARAETLLCSREGISVGELTTGAVLGTSHLGVWDGDREPRSLQIGLRQLGRVRPVTSEGQELLEE